VFSGEGAGVCVHAEEHREGAGGVCKGCGDVVDDVEGMRTGEFRYHKDCFRKILGVTSARVFEELEATARCHAAVLRAGEVEKRWGGKS